MNKHVWLVGIVSDLEEYARIMGLKALSPQLSRLREMVVEEVGTTSPEADHAFLREQSVALLSSR